MADIAAQDAALAAKKAQDSELVALKQQMDRLKGDLTPGQNKQQKLRKACTDFEAVFISKMWEQMRATIPKDGMLHSPQEDMYRSMFDREFSEKLASDGGIGLGDMLYNQLKGKINTSQKTLGRIGPEKAKDSAAAATTTPTTSATGVNGAVEKSALKMPKRPTGAVSSLGTATTATSGISGALAASATSGALPGSISGASGRSSSIPGASSVRSASTQASTQASVPASVPSEVMADVENLARRIEAEYDLRQAQALVQSGQVSGAPATGYGASASGRVAGYGQTGRTGGANSGSKLATIG